MANQPFYKKAGVQSAIVAGLFALIATILTTCHKKDVQPLTTINQSVGENNQGMVIAASNPKITINNSFNAQKPENTKQDLRHLLKSINPKILEMIDAGETEIYAL